MMNFRAAQLNKTWTLIIADQDTDRGQIVAKTRGTQSAYNLVRWLNAEATDAKAANKIIDSHTTAERVSFLL